MDSAWSLVNRYFDAKSRAVSGNLSELLFISRSFIHILASTSYSVMFTAGDFQNHNLLRSIWLPWRSAVL